MTNEDHKNRRKPNADDRRKGNLVPGSLASLDTTLPPTPLKKLLAADGASVYIYSHDDSLVGTVQEAGGQQYPVHVVAERDELLAAVESGLCHIVLLDADALSRNLETFIFDLRAVHPALVILLAAPREAAQTHIGLLSDRSIHRLLIKPAAVGITRLLLESAVSRFLQLRDRAPDPLETRIENLRHRPLSRPKPQWPTWLLAVALVSLLVAAVLVGGIVRLDFGEAETPLANNLPGAPLPDETNVEAVVTEPVRAVQIPVDEPAVQEAEVEAPAVASPSIAPAIAPAIEDPLPEEPVPEPATPAPFAAELARAEEAFAAGEIVRPIGASALDLYAAILAEAPEHPEANERLSRMLESLYSEAEEAMLGGELAAAGTTLAHVRRVRPVSGRRLFLENPLARARDAQTPAAAARAAREARPSEFDSLLGIAAARVQNDQLVAPAGDSAEVYLERAAALNPGDARLRDLRAELAARAVDQARLVLSEGDLEAATVLADAAFRFGADTEALALLELDLVAARELAADRDLARRFELGRDRLARGQLIAPNGDSALDHLSAIRAERPNFSGLDAAWTSLTTAIAERARAAIAAGRWAEAEETMAALEPNAVDAELLDSLQQSLLTTRRQALFLRDAVPAGELTLVEYSPPTYPSAALRRGTEGWVELEYVVGVDGRTSNLRIVEAEPEQIFDEAALEAVAGYVYAPFTLDGQGYERLVRLRIRFTFQ
jgi:protein TonB